MTTYNIRELSLIYKNDPTRFFVKLRFDLLTAAGMITRCPMLMDKKIAQAEDEVSAGLRSFQAAVVPLVREIKLAVGDKEEEFAPNTVNHHFILDFYCRIVELVQQLERIYNDTDSQVRAEINRLMESDEFFNYYVSPIRLMNQLLDVLKAVMMA